MSEEHTTRKCYMADTGLLVTHSSLDKFRNRFQGKTGQLYILYTKDNMIKGDVVHLPVYMAMFL